MLDVELKERSRTSGRGNDISGSFWKMSVKCEIYRDSMQNYKRYGIPKAQLVIADVPYNLGNNMYGSNPMWYVGGDNKNGESKLAGKAAFNSDYNFNLYEYFHFCSKMLKKEPKEKGQAPCMIVFCSFQQIPTMLKAAEKHGFVNSIHLTFCKNYSAQVLKANMRIVGATEHALVLHRGLPEPDKAIYLGTEHGLIFYRDKLPKFNNDGKMIFDWMMWEKDPNGKYPKIHPTQKPVCLLKKLIEIFTDPGDVVIDPCCGSGAILFSKSPSDIETINDLDSDVTNLFRCIQKDSERLARLVMTTPFSREEYDKQFEVQQGANCTDSFERATGFLVRCWQGHGFRTNGYKVGWKNDVQGRESMYALWNWYRLPVWILEIAERLRKVQIENRPALEVIERFNYENVFMYLDPPYLLGTRTAKQYKHEMSDLDHDELLKLILQSKAKIMISGYASEMYDDYLHDWSKVTFRSCAEHHGTRQEVVWMNYDYNLQMSFEDFPEVLP